VKRVRRAEPRWILASESPRRSEILDRLGIKFRVDPSRISEPARKPGETPSRYAVRIARLKAKEVAKRHKAGFILSADTIVVLGDTILLKPKNRADARTMLKSLSGRWHEVVSGICLLDCELGRPYCASRRTRIHFRRCSGTEIEWYLKTGEYRDKAGAYGIQGFASLFVDQIEGCYFNVVGFPIALFEQLCRKAGINLIPTLTQLPQLMRR
jgi:septum formation protein